VRDRALVVLFTITMSAAIACTPETVRPTATVAPSTATAMTTSPPPTRSATPSATPPPNFAVVRPSAQTPKAPLRRPVRRWLVGPRSPPRRSPQCALRITQASTSVFTSSSGFSLRVGGNAFFSVRVSGQAHTDAGQRSYAQADPYRPGLPLIREVKFVTDFEGEVIFGVGLARAACPVVLSLFSPPRLVLDFPTPP
jgi:hypothetical protein